MRTSGLDAVQQRRIVVFYHHVIVADDIAKLMVEDQVTVERKVVTALERCCISRNAGTTRNPGAC